MNILLKSKLLLITLLGVLLVLAGCSVSGNGEEEKELKVLINLPRAKAHYEKYLDSFSKYYEEKEGVKVTFDLEMPSADNEQVLKTRMATGDAPDVFNIHAMANIDTYTNAGYLADLSDLDFSEKLNKEVVDSVTVNDKIYGVPIESALWGYLYNKDIFKEVGIEPADTLDEMESNVQALKQAGYTPFLLSYKDQWVPQLFLPLAGGQLAVGEQENFFQKMNEDKASFSDIGGMFNVMDLINQNGTENALELSAIDGTAEFAKGKAAMWVQGPWFSESILNSNPEFKLGVAPLPVDNNKENTMINMSVSTTLVVSKDSENKEIAKELVNYLYNEEFSNDWFKQAGYNPMSNTHTFDAPAWVEEAQRYVEEGRVYQDPPFPSAVKDESGKILQNYYMGDISKEEVINRLDKSWMKFNEVNN